VVADCMRRSGASYHYAVRRVKQNEELVVRERIANACMDDSSLSFWAAVKQICHGNTGNGILYESLFALRQQSNKQYDKQNKTKHKKLQTMNSTN